MKMNKQNEKKINEQKKIAPVHTKTQTDRHTHTHTNNATPCRGAQVRLCVLLRTFGDLF